MRSIEVQFPKTNYVECIFSIAQNSLDFEKRPDSLGLIRETGRLKRYTYEVPEYLRDQLAVGDFVVVRCVTGYQLAEVARIDVTPCRSVETYAPVVTKVDFKQYLEWVANKQELERMRKALDEAKKSLESLVTYELIAEKSPEFKAMLEKYKAAGGKF